MTASQDKMDVFSHVINVVIELDEMSELYIALLQLYGPNPDIEDVLGIEGIEIDGLQYETIDPAAPNQSIKLPVPCYQWSRLHQLKGFNSYLQTENNGNGNIDWFPITKVHFDNYRMGPHWYDLSRCPRLPTANPPSTPPPAPFSPHKPALAKQCATFWKTTAPFGFYGH